MISKRTNMNVYKLLNYGSFISSYPYLESALYVGQHEVLTEKTPKKVTVKNYQLKLAKSNDYKSFKLSLEL